MSIVSQGLGLRLDKHLGIIVALGYGIDELVPIKSPVYVYGCAKDYITASAAVDMETGSTVMASATLSAVVLSIVESAAASFASGSLEANMVSSGAVLDNETDSQAEDFVIDTTGASEETESSADTATAEATDSTTDSEVVEGLIRDGC